MTALLSEQSLSHIPKNVAPKAFEESTKLQYIDDASTNCEAGEQEPLTL